MTLATTLGIDRLRANALLGLGWALMPADSVVACQRLDQAAQAFQDTDDSWGLAMTLSSRGQCTPSGRAIRHGTTDARSGPGGR